MWIVLMCFALPLVHGYLGSVVDQLVETTKLCCNHGMMYARNFSGDCDSIFDTPVVSNIPVCIFSMKSCCEDYFNKQNECNSGIDLAIDQNSCSYTEDTKKSCCDQCLAGRIMRQKKGLSACVTQVQTNLSEKLVTDDAFVLCCKANINSCKRHKLCQQTCDDSGTEVKCSCQQGYRLKEDGVSCEDIDECATGENGCVKTSQYCINTLGIYFCQDKDSKRCSLSGFRINATTNMCQDIDECEEGTHTCDQYQTCHNTIGSYSCHCTVGFEMDWGTGFCIDINECVEGTHNCEENQRCLNTYGSHECPCKTGFEINPVTGHCTDINECELGTSNCIRHSQRCENTVGSFVCIRFLPCGTGYTMHPTSGTCEDIDECARGLHNCRNAGPQYRCINIPGNYRCTHRTRIYPSPKYNSQANKLNPENTTSLSIVTTSKPTTIQILPTKTYTILSVTVEPTIKNNLRNEDSANVNAYNGFYKPTPILNELPETKNSSINNKAGVNIQINKIISSDLASSLKNNDIKDDNTSHTTNITILNKYPPHVVKESARTRAAKGTDGSVIEDDNNISEDIDECATGEAKCGPSQTCINLQAGYKCSCLPGFRLVSEHECKDIDECALSTDTPMCSQNAECINTIGSYHCKCHDGFHAALANDKVCIAIDECSTSGPRTVCQQRCIKTWSGHECFCYKGFRLNADNKTCSDIDECEESKERASCIGLCRNVPGSFYCSCPPGYQLNADKRSCIDIDECEINNATCPNGNSKDSSNICFNIRGSYHCHNITCPPGYRFENENHCSNIDLNGTKNILECADKPTTYSYHFINIVSNLELPNKSVQLFLMRGPFWPTNSMKFHLDVLKVTAPSSVKEKANITSFSLSQVKNSGIVSLLQSLEGPQRIELELTIKLFTEDCLIYSRVAKMFIFVSEYDF